MSDTDLFRFEPAGEPEPRGALLCLLPPWHQEPLRSFPSTQVCSLPWTPIPVGFGRDVDQGAYQEPQEFYPEPSYSATELPGYIFLKSMSAVMDDLKHSFSIIDKHD